MKIICLMGPTAVGKTHIAMELVKHLPCDIISVDSGMIYRQMDIGTAKPTLAEQQQAPHRLIDILDPSESYFAAQFCNDAKREIESIIAANRIPLLVGGTMLYFRALQYGLSDLPAADAKVRAELKAEIDAEGLSSLYARLQQVDAQAAAKIKSNDVQRIVRALEVYTISGKTISELTRLNKPTPLPYEAVNIALLPESKTILNERIEKRLQQMLAAGFVEEVEQLYRRGDLDLDMPSIRTVGYRQLWDYLLGKYDLETAQEKVLIATRQLAKRQLTWLRSWESLHTLVCDQSQLLDSILNLV